MTEENSEEVEEEQNYDYPEYRESASGREFLEGEVGAFVEYGDGDEYLNYGDYYVPAEDVDAHSEHSRDARVQIEVVEPLNECEYCGDEFKSVEQHQTLSECGDE